MARAPDERIEQAKAMYLKGMKLVEIASQLKVSEGTVRSWKSRYKWNCNVANGKRNVAKRKKEENSKNKKAIVDEVEQVLENTALTDKQRLFCLYYIRCFNATKAYQKAYACSYEVANSEGYKLLVNPCVREEIKRLKQNRLNRELLDESDIFQKYMDIAFSDITEYVRFGTEEVPVMAMYGPVKVKDEETGQEKILTKRINSVYFKESEEIDGTIISEVKQGKDGASIKLLDKMKALEWISDHMDLATTEQRARIENIRAKTEQIKGSGQNETEDKVMKLFDLIGGALDAESE